MFGCSSLRLKGNEKIGYRGFRVVLAAVAECHDGDTHLEEGAEEVHGFADVFA